MSLKANNKGDVEFEITPEGTYHAICYGVIDIGTQKGSYKGKEKFTHKCIIIWEIPSLRTDDDKPVVISNMYTVSLSDRAILYKHLKAWRGKSFTTEELEDFDLSALQGKNCSLQIIHNKKDDKTYANVETITPLMEGIEPKQSENTPIVYELQPGFIPEGMYDWIANKIKESLEWNEDKSQEPEQVDSVESF